MRKVFLALMAAVWLTMVIGGATFYFMGREPTRGGDFTLESKDGPWNFKKNAKTLNLLYFGYSKCPDVCPLSLSTLSQAYGQLTPEERSSLQVIFVSVDSAHDTGESVGKFAAQFQPSFVGLTGPKEKIDFAAKLMGASYIVEQAPKSRLGYSIAHTDRIFFLDRDGEVTDDLPNPRDPSMVVGKIRRRI